MDRYYHIYKRVDDDMFTHLGLIKVLDENDDSLIQSYCMKQIGNKYIAKGGKILENWKYHMCYKTYEDVTQTIKRRN